MFDAHYRIVIIAKSLLQVNINAFTNGKSCALIIFDARLSVFIAQKYINQNN
jgi:hypothetical protein